MLLTLSHFCLCFTHWPHWPPFVKTFFTYEHGQTSSKLKIPSGLTHYPPTSAQYPAFVSQSIRENGLYSLSFLYHVSQPNAVSPEAQHAPEADHANTLPISNAYIHFWFSFPLTSLWHLTLTAAPIVEIQSLLSLSSCSLWLANCPSLILHIGFF